MWEQPHIQKPLNLYTPFFREPSLYIEIVSYRSNQDRQQALISIHVYIGNELHGALTVCIDIVNCVIILCA